MLHRIETFCQRLLEFVAGMLVLAIAAILLLQVVGRHVFEYPFSWPEEVAGFMFVWLIFLGAITAYRRGGLIGIDWLIGKLQPLPREIIRMLSNLIVIVLLAALIWNGVEATVAASGTRTTVLRFTWAWIYAAMPIGFAVLLLSFIITLLGEIRRFSRRLRADHDPADVEDHRR